MRRPPVMNALGPGRGTSWNHGWCSASSAVMRFIGSYSSILCRKIADTAWFITAWSCRRSFCIDMFHGIIPQHSLHRKTTTANGCHECGRGILCSQGGGLQCLFCCHAFRGITLQHPLHSKAAVTAAFQKCARGTSWKHLGWCSVFSAVICLKGSYCSVLYGKQQQ